MSGAAAAAAAAIQAIRASGVVVRVSPESFLRILERDPCPLIVHSVGGLFGMGVHESYLTTYRGLAFHTKSPVKLPLPESAEVIEARSMWAPA